MTPMQVTGIIAAMHLRGHRFAQPAPEAPPKAEAPRNQLHIVKAACVASSRVSYLMRVDGMSYLQAREQVAAEKPIGPATWRIVEEILGEVA